MGHHACRPQDLSYWIDAELWRIELEGPLRERATQIEARRGRLLDRIDDWNEKQRAAFGLGCVFQTGDPSAFDEERRRESRWICGAARDRVRVIDTVSIVPTKSG